MNITEMSRQPHRGHLVEARHLGTEYFLECWAIRISPKIIPTVKVKAWMLALWTRPARWLWTAGPAAKPAQKKPDKKPAR